MKYVQFKRDIWRRLLGGGFRRSTGDQRPPEGQAAVAIFLREKQSALTDRVSTIVGAKNRLNASAENGWRFVGNTTDKTPTPEIVVSFDMLARLSSVDEYRSALSALAAYGVPILLSGLDFPPMTGQPDLRFFEPLSGGLDAVGYTPFPVDSHDGLSVYVAIPSGSVSPRDIATKTLRTAIDLSVAPLLLFESVVRSRALLGFFPDHLPRCIEYPWVTNHLDHAAALRVVDIGAGVSVLPFMLADRGHRVLTVDPHTIVRKLDEKASWTEWGYLNYAQIDKRVNSLNIPYQELGDDQKFDAVVSVSVVEHLPRVTRNQCIEKAYRHLSPGGTLLLTVDTEPFSNRLWNYSEGVQVESSATHGTVDDLAREIIEAGFTLELVESAERIPLARVGMARFMARKPL